MIRNARTELQPKWVEEEEKTQNKSDSEIKQKKKPNSVRGRKSHHLPTLSRGTFLQCKNWVFIYTEEEGRKRVMVK